MTVDAEILQTLVKMPEPLWADALLDFAVVAPHERSRSVPEAYRNHNHLVKRLAALLQLPCLL